MASTQEIKRRIKAVTSTRQITKAMELVSATKMRKSQEVALLSRPYAVESLRILGELMERSTYIPHIMEPREVKKIATVVIASDRGLAGSFNANVLRALERHVSQTSKEGHSFIAVGKKTREYLERRGFSITQSFSGFGDYGDAAQVKPLTTFIVEGFLKGEWDQVTVISTHFRSTLRQEVMTRRVLPIDAATVKKTVRELVPEYGRYSGAGKDVFGSASLDEKKDFEYLIEPNPKAALDALAPALVEIMLYDLILEANASEHSARMVAMKNASENAAELKDELSVEYNKSRQAAITREIAEVVSGAEALT